MSSFCAALLFLPRFAFHAPLYTYSSKRSRGFPPDPLGRKSLDRKKIRSQLVAYLKQGVFSALGSWQEPQILLVSGHERHNSRGGLIF